MNLITFSSLPLSPQVISECIGNSEGNGKVFQIRQGKENRTKYQHIDESSIQNHLKRLIQKSYLQFNLHKTQIKQLYENLKYYVEPQRENLLEELVKNQKQLSSLKAIVKNYHLKTVELKSQFNKLKVEKDKQDKVLSEFIQKNLQIYAQIEQNQSRKYLLTKNIQQLEQQKQQKDILALQKQQKYHNNLQQFNIQLNRLSKLYEDQQKPESYIIENDLQVETITKYVENAKLHGQELKDCLSARFQYLIQLKQSRHDKEIQLLALDQQNSVLEDKINLLSSDLNLITSNKQQVNDEVNEEQFKLNSVQMQNIELRARLQILHHSLNGQINHNRSTKQIIQNQQNLTQNAHIASFHTQTCLEKLIALKLQTQYLQTRLKFSLIK